MASPQEVQTYLAYWFQLGKSVSINNGQTVRRPATVLEGERLSEAFQDCWRAIMEVKGRDCYLEGSTETIEQLLSPQWQITDCALCSLPTAMSNVMPVAGPCTCSDLDCWPNDEMPPPHMPINNKKHFNRLKNHLNQQHPLGSHPLESRNDGQTARVNHGDVTNNE